MTVATQYETIEFSVGDDHVATITLNRSDRLNSFTETMANELTEVWGMVRDTDAIHDVVPCTDGDVDVDTGTEGPLSVGSQHGPGRQPRPACSSANPSETNGPPHRDSIAHRPPADQPSWPRRRILLHSGSVGVVDCCSGAEALYESRQHASGDHGRSVEKLGKVSLAHDHEGHFGGSRHVGIAWPAVEQRHLAQEIARADVGDMFTIAVDGGLAGDDDEELVTRPTLTGQNRSCRNVCLGHEAADRLNFLVGQTCEQGDVREPIID